LEELDGVSSHNFGGELALGHVDLLLSVGKGDIDTTVDGLAVSGGVEDVANGVALVEGSVGHLEALLVVGVGQRNEELALGVGEELRVSVALNPLAVPDLGLFALGVHLGNDLVKVRVAVHGLPERFAVLGIIASAVVLLSTVVDEGNTVGGHGEDGGGAETLLVASVVAEEAGVVVVIDEDTKGRDVLEVALLLVVAVLDLAHVLSSAEDVGDGVVHGVVEKSGEVLLVGTDVGGIAVEALAHLEDTGGFTELRPEVLGHLGDGVNAEAVEAVGVDEVLDPVLELATDPLVLLVEVGEVGKAAVLNLTLVIEVGNLAVVVVVVSRVVGSDLAKVVSDGRDVVSNDVDHHPDVHGVGGGNEGLEVVGGSEVLVDGVPVAGPVAVVSGVEVVNNGADPDGVESHTLDVVQVVLNTLEGSTAVVAEVTAGAIVLAILSKAISEELVNGALLPGSGVASVGDSGNGSRGEGGAHSVLV
jgi:hypothetical protein